MATVLALKQNPKCSATCCLEILQLVTDAPGKVTSISALEPPTESQDLFRNVAELKDEEEHEPVQHVPTKELTDLKDVSTKDVKDVSAQDVKDVCTKP